jgi:hypothetical protein
MALQGRLTSLGSERAYRDTLYLLADEVGNRDPRTVTRNDVKRVLRRWTHPNTQRNNRSVFISFFDWSMEEGYRKDSSPRSASAYPAPSRSGSTGRFSGLQPKPSIGWCSA